MIRLLTRCAATLLLLVATPAFAQLAPPYAPDRVIVKFKDGARSGGPSPLPAAAKATVEWRFRSGAQLLRIRGVTVEDAVAALSSDPRVEYAEPDYIVSIAQPGGVLPADPRVGEQYALDNNGQTGGTVDADIDAAEAWSIQTGDDMLIGVIDTGIDYRHQDLAANVWVNPGEIPGNGVDDDGNGFIDDVHGWDFINGDNDPMDDNQHGTHVSGIIAAVGNNGVGVVGVCWSARLVAIKTLDANGVGTMSIAAAGIEYATRMGVRLTNNSWGSASYSRVLDDALAELAATDAIFVAAAGNNARSNDLFPQYPSGYPYDNIVAVASTNHDDTLSVTSNYGAETVDLAAPGEDILSLFPGDDYGLLTGTSMATPHVTGAVALIATEAPLMTTAQIKETLLRTVDRVPAMDGRAVSDGRLNVYRALSTLDAVPPGRIDDLRVDETGSNTVTLVWTAGGDDGDAGTASAYDIRYSTSPIKPSSFDRAARIEDVPAPAPAGTRQLLRVDGLDVKTTYFFAMRALDDRANPSEMSKMAVGRTQGTPEVSFSPRDFTGTALTGAVLKRTIEIANDGKGTIDFAFRPGVQGWVAAEPPYGTVGARATVTVAISLDAFGLAGGDYDDVITLLTNDPAVPTVDLPVHLSVTSAPHVVVSDQAMEFGAWFVGARVEREVRVTNRGDRLLTVTAVAVEEADPPFEVDTGAFTLPPAGERAITVAFAPRSPTEISAHLRIESDDPDDGVVVVALTGRGLPPPDVAVSPSALDAELHTGAASSDTVTIVNEGSSDLHWHLSFDDGAGVPGADRGADDEGPFRDLDGVRVLYDAAHWNLHWFNYNTLFLDLKARGATVTVSEEPFTAEYLDGFDVVWMAESFNPLAPEELDALVSWVRAGGGLLLEGDYDRSIPVFNNLLRSLVAGIEYSFVDGATGVTNRIETHETTRGVHDVFLQRVKASLPSVRPPARPLIYDIDGVCNTAWSRSGAGRLIIMADQNLANHRMGEAGNQVLGNRVVDWLAEGVTWLGATPTAGVLAPGQSQVLVVTVDAEGLDGPFDARLVVNSNDPDEPAVHVAVHLDATPAPDIATSAAAIRFPDTAVGDSALVEVLVGNTGTLPLEVTEVASSDAEFLVTPAAFDVAPGEVVPLMITFVPPDESAIAAVVSITSNDPDEAVTSIDVSGEGYTGTRDSLVAVASRVEATHTAAPQRTALHPNVPNPFNPTTTIAYDLRDASHVTVVVYNVRGQIVRTLVDDVRPSGRHTILWDGRSDTGGPVATGVYFCRLIAGPFTATRKMVLLK